MDGYPLPTSGCAVALRRLLVASAVLCLLAGGGSASAGETGSAFSPAKTYAGVFAGSGLTGNRLVDVDGFANWGHPGSISKYDNTGFAWGALAGWRFQFAHTLLRVEVDATFGDLSASTNQLDPEGLDETAAADYQWVATARAGIEDTLGGVTVFATGGLAAARIDNWVTDIDFGPNRRTQKDPDDSFRDSSMDFGWVIGAGVETALADTWTLRLEGSYLDFGRSTYYVNYSGNNSCGPGGSYRSCPYRIENNLGIVRLAVIRRFGP